MAVKIPILILFLFCDPCDPSLGPPENVSPQHRYDIVQNTVSSICSLFFLSSVISFCSVFSAPFLSASFSCISSSLITIFFYFLLVFFFFYCILFSSILLIYFALLLCYLLICYLCSYVIY